jgi:hypothetical protein
LKPVKVILRREGGRWTKSGCIISTYRTVTITLPVQLLQINKMLQKKRNMKSGLERKLKQRYEPRAQTIIFRILSLPNAQ